MPISRSPATGLGLALKGVEAEDLDRGYVLTNDPAIKSSLVVTGKAQLVKYWPAPLKEEMVIYLGHWMQFLPSRLKKVTAEGDWRMPELTFILEKELVYPPGARMVLHYLEGGKLRCRRNPDVAIGCPFSRRPVRTGPEFFRQPGHPEKISRAGPAFAGSSAPLTAEDYRKLSVGLQPGCNFTVQL